jgi:hypothetical protein
MVPMPSLGIIGAVTGIIGAITGSAALLLAWISYRRSQQIKALDLRLELRKQVSDVRTVVAALPDLLERSRASRIGVLAAIGVLKSGAFEIWEAGLESDLKTAQALTWEVPDADETYQRSKYQDLETKLVEVHTLAGNAARLRDKYQTELAYDDKQRDHIKADVRIRLNPPDGRLGL